MKPCLVFIVALFLIPIHTFAQPGSSDSTQGVLEEGFSQLGANFRDQFKPILAQYKGMAEANRQLKAAGASYQKHLTAPVTGISRYITPVGQALAAGAYSFDTGYAALFMRKREFADSLKARTLLNEKLGMAMPLSDKVKQLIENPQRIGDYKTWCDAVEDAIKKLMTKGIDSDQRLCMAVNYLYGITIEGMYVITETIALSGYSPQMLELMAFQRKRISLFLQTLNVFRGDTAFEKAVGFDTRFRLLGQVHNLMQVKEFTRRDIDDIRRLIAPERRAILAI